MDTHTTQIHNFHEGDKFHEHYRLLEHVGSGGFADVWRAKDELVDTIVALKIYTRLDKEGISELAKEYKDMRGIKHPNLLTGNHFDASGNIPYLEMDYCDGGSLYGKMGRMNSEELRHVVRDIAGGLACLHREGIVHQDIKPENILYDTARDRYLLSDFGISGKSRTRLSHSVNKANMTLSMTEAYAPPEKFSGNMADIEPDTKGDIFSLGMTLFESATGILPFTPPMATGREMLYSQGRLQLDYSKISDPRLRRIVEQCTKYRKEDRPTAERVLALLDEPLEEPQPRQESAGNTDNTGHAGNAKRPTERIKVNSESKTDSRKPPRPPKPPVPPTPDSNGKRRVYIAVAVGVAVLLAALLATMLGHRSEPGTVVAEVGSADSQTFTVNGVDFTMVSVPGGSYTMGCTTEQGDDCYGDEKPAHSVTVSGFYMGQTEVTQALWKAVMGTTVRQQRDKADVSWPIYGEGDNYPMYYVSWQECQEFVTKLNSLTGQTFRLPTEAEWEYAARGGNSSRGYKYSGSDNVGSVAWYDGNSGSLTHPVARKQANELGLYDMSGNVWEWCSDWYGDYGSGSQTDPRGPASGSRRVLRGGSWDISARYCRVSGRGSSGPSGRYNFNGFRLALSR